MPQLTMTQRAWLILARGGWWTASEVSEEIDAEVDVSTLYNRLHVMAHRNGNAVARGSKPNTEYAVTARCQPPRGLTVAQISDALAIGARVAA